MNPATKSGQTSSPQPHAGRIDASGIDEYRLTTPPWEVDLRQMSPGQLFRMIDRLIEKFGAHAELLDDAQVRGAVEWQLLGASLNCSSPAARMLVVCRHAGVI